MAQLSLPACVEAGIPVRLLLDLANSDGPDSRAIYAAEQSEPASSDQRFRGNEDVAKRHFRGMLTVTLSVIFEAQMTKNVAVNGASRERPFHIGNSGRRRLLLRVSRCG